MDRDAYRAALELKTCSKCGVDKLRDEFARDRQRPDGLHSQCKDCKNVSRGTKLARTLTTDQLWAMLTDRSDLEELADRLADRLGKVRDQVGLDDVTWPEDVAKLEAYQQLAERFDTIYRKCLWSALVRHDLRDLLPETNLYSSQVFGLMTEVPVAS